MDSTNNKNIGLVHGGDTPEGQVSTMSAEAVNNVLSNHGYSTTLINYTENNFVDKLSQVDLVFNCLHGEFGEDGQLQAILEELNISFTGSDSSSSELCRDKVDCKNLLLSRDILTPRYFTNKEEAENFMNLLRTTLLIKKRKSGGGIGINKAHSLSDLNINYDEYFVEEFIKGTIITVGVIESDGAALASPPIEIVLPAGKDLYDFDSKVNCKAHFRLFTDGNDNQIRKHALVIHELTGCRGFSRIDFILSNDDKYFLEINTIPSFFEGSSYRYSMEQLGFSMSELCESIIKSALFKV